MKKTRCRRLWSGIALATIVLLVSSTNALGADQSPPVAIPSERPGAAPVDFLFGQPRTSVSIRGTWAAPRERGDLYEFVREHLTIDQGAFRSAAVNAEAGAAINPRFGVLVGFEGSRASVESEYRRFIGSDNLPIAQRSQLDSMTVYASLKVALTEPGRRISRYAWIPNRVTPFVGAGAGAVHHRFEQDGEFVDFVDRSIFPDKFVSKGWGPSGHVFGGADVRVWQNVYLTLDARYVWARADMGPDFVGFNGIDLSGFRMGSGVTLVF